MNRTIILTTGGTGGHIFPARVIADNLANQGFKAVIFGDENYVKYHKKNDVFSYEIISSSQIKKSPIFLIKAAFKIIFGVFQSLFLITKYNPEKIVAFGGYSTFPTIIAAIILRKKIILHEQNAHLGKVNRIFAKYAYKIVLSFENTSGITGDIKTQTIFTGNPVRKEIFALSNSDYRLPKEKENFNILIIGGSGGAKIFSEVLPKAFLDLDDKTKNYLHITQQCRAENVESTFNQYKSFNISANVSHFFEDMAKEICTAHLVIARSGSTSIAEFTCAKRPMILVPFAASADNHQQKNAEEIAKKGGAIVIKEQDFTINNVSAILQKLINDESELRKMSDNSFKCANLNAKEDLTKLIQNV